MDDSLLFRAIKGQTTPAEQRAVEAWRRALPAHEARYQELVGVLSLTARRGTAETTPPAALEVLEVAARRDGRHGRRAWALGVGVTAAGIAALLLAGVALDRGRAGAPAETAAAGDEFGFEEMVTGENQTVTVAMRDGSVMRLAPRSHARIRVREGSRVVHLTGRAFFSVAKRSGQPFVVKTRGGDVTVLGTQFDLDATNDDVRVVVVEGKVALAGARGGEAQVGRGQAARVVEGTLLPAVTPVEAREATHWVGRFLAFQATPLSEVAMELERAYGARVTIADTTLAEQTVTNWFSDRPLDDVVRIICAIVATECTVQGDDVTIGRLARE